MGPVSIPSYLRSYAAARAYVRKRRLAEYRASLPPAWIRLADTLFDRAGVKTFLWWVLALSPMALELVVACLPVSQTAKVGFFLVAATVSVAAAIGTSVLLFAWICASERSASSPYRAAGADPGRYEAARDPRAIALEVIDRLQASLNDHADSSVDVLEQQDQRRACDQIRKEIQGLREQVVGMPFGRLPQPPVARLLRPPAYLNPETLFNAEVAHRYDAILAKVDASR